MKRLKDYKYTFNSCCIGSGIQAIGISLPPLLFVSFQDSFNISVTQLTALVTLTFLVQLAIDAASAKFIDKIGYRATAITSHAFVFVGLILTGVLPYTLSSPYVGLIIGTIFTSIGCGLIEVVISPLVEAIPDKKAGKMSLLHSCYCFGYLFVVLISVIYFVIFDRNSWQFLVFGFAAIPLLNGIFFFFVPCTSLDEQRGESMSIGSLLKCKLMYLFVLLILCAGACEQAMCQWVSYFAEKSLNLSKATGDLVGPFSFALLMGLGRLFYGLFGYKIHIKKVLQICGFFCLACYIVAVASSVAIVSLIACALCGLAVSVMWPGALDMASKNIKNGGTGMFALMALGGDIGCTLGPSIVGYVTDASPYGLKGGLSTALIFCALFIITSLILFKTDKSENAIIQPISD